MRERRTLCFPFRVTVSRPFARSLWLAVLNLFLGGFTLDVVRAQSADEEDFVAPFNWDLVSLEQNNPRFNASVLSGFHSVRSPGVTPFRAWKTGLGLLYSREEQVAVATNTRLFDRQEMVLNPKVNYGIWDQVEAGLGFEAIWANGKEIRGGAPAGTIRSEEGFEASAVGVGAKWGFLDEPRFRMALSLDSRIAINKSAFGALPASLLNVEIDADYAITSRWGVITNLQFITGVEGEVDDEVVFDLGTTYTFTDRFRGMLFATAKEDDEAGSVVLFTGIAGQYVFEQHSFTLALDFQLTDADREIRSQSQVDVELSYTFTF